MTRRAVYAANSISSFISWSQSLASERSGHLAVLMATLQPYQFDFSLWPPATRCKIQRSILTHPRAALLADTFEVAVRVASPWSALGHSLPIVVQFRLRCPDCVAA
jgi:hypothetical protein